MLTSRAVTSLQNWTGDSVDQSSLVTTSAFSLSACDCQ